MPSAPSAKKCSYAGCKKPTESVHFFRIDGKGTAGGQDWSKLAGSVLCRSCYVQYSKTGTLDRIKQGPLAKSAKRCCYDGCKSPTESRQFLRIEGVSQAGGQDWTELDGCVLCKRCYDQFCRCGTLERTKNEPLAESERRCTYEGCRGPRDSGQYIQIHGRSGAGGRDWSALAGSVLCRSCYVQFSKTGSLERMKNGPLAGSERRCSYLGCKSPNESGQFIQIDGASEAGGRDWTELAGSVLCQACYSCYVRRGTLERYVPGSEPTPSTPAAPAVSSRKRRTRRDDENVQKPPAATLERYVPGSEPTPSTPAAPAVSSRKRRTRRDDENVQKPPAASKSSRSSGGKKKNEVDVKAEEQAQEAYNGLLILSSVLDQLTG